MVSLHGAGKGQLEITGVSPSGETVPVDLQLSDSEPDTYIVNYTPSEIGEHKIYVKFAGVNVRGSPFIVKVADPSKVLVQMSSLTEAQNAMMVGKEVVIPLEILSGAGEGELEADITGPGDVAVESSFTRQTDTLYHFRFIPPVPGEYVIRMLYGGGLVGGQALNAYVKEAYVKADASKCVVYGEGMKECKHDFRFTFFRTHTNRIGYQDTMGNYCTSSFGFVLSFRTVATGPVGTVSTELLSGTPNIARKLFWKLC